MSENEDSSYGKAKPIKKEYKRKRTKKEEAELEGKMILVCEFCPQGKEKKYLSYPALYLHVREKHPGESVTSSKAKDKQKDNPESVPAVLKLKSILKANDPQREEIERELFDIKQLLCFKLSQTFISGNLLEYGQIGEKNTEGSLGRVRELALQKAYEVMLKQQIFQSGQKGQIFLEYYTRIMPLSFGFNVVRYFTKKPQIAAKVYLQMVLLEAVDQGLIDKEQLSHFERVLWSDNAASIGVINENWLLWKAVDKESLTEQGKQDERYSRQ